MKKDDVLICLIFFIGIVLCTICIGKCIEQMFLDVELWIKIIACVGSHLMLLADVGLICGFIFMIDWKED